MMSSSCHCTVSQWGKSLGSKFGVQIWNPILVPKIWTHLAMIFRLPARDGLAVVQILTRCQEGPRRLWLQHLPHGSIKQIKHLFNCVLVKST